MNSDGSVLHQVGDVIRIGTGPALDQPLESGDILICTNSNSVRLSDGSLFINDSQVKSDDPAVVHSLAGVIQELVSGSQKKEPSLFDEFEIQSLQEAVEIAGRKVGPASWGMSLQLLAKLEELKEKP